MSVSEQALVRALTLGLSESETADVFFAMELVAVQS